MKIFFTAITLMASLIAINANAALIDDFNGGDIVVQATGSSNTNYSNAFGGNRAISIEKTGLLTANSTVGAGQYSHNVEALTSATSVISWHSTTGIDLTDGGDTSYFALDIASIAQGNIDLTLLVTDILNQSSSYTLLNSGAGINRIALSYFSGFNFLQVKDIELTIKGGSSADFSLNSISTVPTPSVLVLLGVGLAAFSFNRRMTA